MKEKQNKPLISIIIPVYNVEKYIEKCLTSIMNQTYKNIEIIIINDGSTDKSLNVLKKVSCHDNRINIIDIENNGVSNARNLGIENSNGKYLIFVDSDDWVETNYVELLVKHVKEYNAEIASCSYDNSETKVNKIISNSIEIVSEKKELYNYLLLNENFSGYLWNKIFDAEIIRHHNIKFDKELHINEDLVFICEYLKYTKYAVLIKDKLYHYIIRKNSALNTHLSIKQISKIKALSIIIEFYKKYDEDDLPVLYYEYVMIACKTLYILKINHCNAEKIKNNCKDIIKSYYEKVYNKANIMDKIKLTLIRFAPKLYFFIK